MNLYKGVANNLPLSIRPTGRNARVENDDEKRVIGDIGDSIQKRRGPVTS